MIKIRSAVARMASMSFMKRPNDFLFRVLVVVASVSLAALSLLVIYSVVMRYVFNDAPDFVEPIALLLVIVIAMFGAALKVREGGHIGLDSLVKKLPPKGQLRDGVSAALPDRLRPWRFFSAPADGGDHDRRPDSHSGLAGSVPLLHSIPGQRLHRILFSIEHLLALFARNTNRRIMELAILAVSFLVFLVLGVPVSFALGACPAS